MGCWRKQTSAKLTGLVMLDIDHVENPKGLFERIPQHMFDEGAEQQIMLAHVTPSGKGLRLVFKASERIGNLGDNQQAMATKLQVENDAATKDASRLSFAPMKEDILFINEHLFDYDNKDYDQHFGEFYRKGLRGHEKKEVQKHEDTEEHASLLVSSPYDYQKIVDEWVKENGDTTVGNRHQSLLRMAGDLRYITDNNPKQLAEVCRLAAFVRDIERERGADEIERVSADVCQRHCYFKTPQRLSAILGNLGYRTGDHSDTAQGTDEANDGSNSIFWSRLEPLLAPPYDAAVAGVDDENKMGAVMVAGAMFCTLMTRTWYKHYDGQMHRMNPQVYVIGDPAAGKSFADHLDRNIMEAMRSADQPVREAEERYKREKRERTTSTKAQKQDALAEPDGMVRYLPSRTSNAIFYQRAIRAKEMVNKSWMPLHLYTFDSELDSSITAQSGGSWIGKHDLELKAFHNELSGVDYANSDSVNRLIPIYWNQVVTGTPISLAKKITLRNVNDGLCSRIAVFKMAPKRFQMIERCELEAKNEQREKLKEWGYYFEKQHGELKIERLIDHVYQLCAQSAQEAEERNDLVLDYLRKRAVFYATWFTIPQIVARQREAEEQDLEHIEVTDNDLKFATLVYDAVLYYQDRFFGQMLLDSWENSKRDFVARKKHSKNAEAYEQLSEEFTTNDAMKLLEITATAARMQCSRWISSGYIERIKNGKFKKIIKAIII